MEFEIIKPDFPPSDLTLSGVWPYLASVGVDKTILEDCCFKKGIVKKVSGRTTVTVEIDEEEYDDVPVWMHTDIGSRLSLKKEEEKEEPADYFKDAAFMFPLPKDIIVKDANYVNQTTLEPEVLALVHTDPETEAITVLGVVHILKSVLTDFSLARDKAFPTWKMYAVFQLTAVTLYHDDLPYRPYYDSFSEYAIIDVMESKIASVPTFLTLDPFSHIPSDPTLPFIEINGISGQEGDAENNALWYFLSNPRRLVLEAKDDSFTQFVINRNDGRFGIISVPPVSPEPVGCCSDCATLDDGSCTGAGWVWPTYDEFSSYDVTANGPYYGSYKRLIGVGSGVLKTHSEEDYQLKYHYYGFGSNRFSTQEGEGAIISGALVPVVPGYFQHIYPDSIPMVPYRDSKWARQFYFSGSPLISVTFEDMPGETFVINQISSWNTYNTHDMTFSQEKADLGLTLPYNFDYYKTMDYTIDITLSFMDEEIQSVFEYELNRYVCHDSYFLSGPITTVNSPYESNYGHLVDISDWPSISWIVFSALDFVIRTQENLFFNVFGYSRIYSSFLYNYHSEQTLEYVGGSAVPPFRYDYSKSDNIALFKQINDSIIDPYDFNNLVLGCYEKFITDLASQPYHDFYTGTLTPAPPPQSIDNKNEAQRRNKKIEFKGYYFIPNDLEIEALR